MKRLNLFVSPQHKVSKCAAPRMRFADGCVFGTLGGRPPVASLAFRIVAGCLAVVVLVLTGKDYAAASTISITSPANGATVSATMAITTSQSPDISWINIFVDKTLVGWSWNNGLPTSSASWNSASVANGSHTIEADGFTIMGAMLASATSVVTVQNGGVSPAPTPIPPVGGTPAPTPAPLPTAGPTPAPPAAGAYPLPDATAASMVAMNPGFEPRPLNFPANHSVPTAAQLASMGSLSFLDSHGNSLLLKTTGNFKGTTDEILQWAAFKWGFDPDITRANAVTETHWNQYDIGDIGNGVSLGILQIKSADYTGTCNPVALAGGDTSLVTDPSCMSYNYTAFAADYKLAYQRACMDASITYLAAQTPNAGYPDYNSATGDARLWGCIGDWFSGSWYDSGAISYIQDVQNNLTNKPWRDPSF